MLSKVAKRFGLKPLSRRGVARDEFQFLADSKAYWSGGYLLDNRGPEINSPEAYFSSSPDYFEKAIPVMKKHQCNSFFEIGCNAGRNLKLIHTEFEGCSVRGVDINSDAIQFLRDNYPEASRFQLDVADITDISYFKQFPDNSIDCVFASSVLIHIPPGEIKKQIIAEMARIKTKILVLIEAHTDGEIVLDNRQNSSRSPFCVDNYRRYTEGMGQLSVNILTEQANPYRLIVLE